MNRARASELIGNFNKQILVIGDVMLDRFVWGDVNRFSPEAPSCKVLDFDHEELMLGGAANVATNLVSLGAEVRLVGLAGYDDSGRDLASLLFQSEIANNLKKSSSRKTTTKVRFVSQEDAVHLLRVDHEAAIPASDREQEDLLHEVERCLGDVSGIVIADYGKGVITRGLIREIMVLAAGRNIPVFVDPKKDHWEHYRGAELVKPNKIEAYAALGLKPSGGDPNVGDRLLKYTRAKAVAVTLGSDGIALYTDLGPSLSHPRSSVIAVDVSGAGDTTMAALTLARLAGAGWLEAMDLANTAAGIVVGKRGTSTVSADELLNKYGEVENA
jgi:rfaE bifunctional protein kinase chain/domain